MDFEQFFELFPADEAVSKLFEAMKSEETFDEKSVEEAKDAVKKALKILSDWRDDFTDEVKSAIGTLAKFAGYSAPAKEADADKADQYGYGYPYRQNFTSRKIIESIDEILKLVKELAGKKEETAEKSEAVEEEKEEVKEPEEKEVEQTEKSGESLSLEEITEIFGAALSQGIQELVNG